MEDPPGTLPNHAHHERHRALSIRGKSFCDSACVFCVEKYTTHRLVSPTLDETRQLILQGAGKYNMLFFMNGEPSLHPKLFEYVELAKENGYRYFGMSSHFRAFADPKLAARVLLAGFEFLDISLHAATYASQLEVNPIDDAGRSLKEALHGLRNMYALARRYERPLSVTHKIVISRLNVGDLLAIFRATYAFGVRNFILQPVKTSGLEPAMRERLAINEDEFMPAVNQLLRVTEGSGATVKLYGMSQVGAYQGEHLIQEQNLIKHSFSKRNNRFLPDLVHGDTLVSKADEVSAAPSHQVTVHLPDMSQSATFACREDQLILNAALAAGVPLPFGCRMGSCGMCVGKILEGTVTRDEHLVLTEAEVARGLTPLCKSRPTSDVVIVTHQESEIEI